MHRKEKDRLGIMRVFLDHGADPCLADARGAMPLHYAASPEEVKLLLSRGADISARTIGRVTPFLQAVEDDRLEVCTTLLELGADYRDCDAAHRTALHLARSAAMVRLLLAAGCDLEARDRNGRTPLMFSLQEDVCRALLEAGASVHAVDKSGKTVLMCSECGDIFPLLVEHGASLEARDPYGRTALHLQSQGAVLSTLVELGAETQARDSEGYTPLMLAAAVEACCTDEYWYDTSPMNIMGCDYVEDMVFFEHPLSTLIEEGVRIGQEDYARMVRELGDDCEAVRTLKEALDN